MSPGFPGTVTLSCLAIFYHTGDKSVHLRPVHWCFLPEFSFWKAWKHLHPPFLIPLVLVVNVYFLPGKEEGDCPHLGAVPILLCN